MIRVVSFGETNNDWRDRYVKMTKGLIPFEWTQIPLKRSPNKRSSQLLPEEVQFLKNHKRFFILDSSGKQMSSKDFYTWCFKGDRLLVIGPAIGFHSDFKSQAEGILSLSELTFTHNLAHVMVAESIYRSACMLKNHPFVK